VCRRNVYTHIHYLLLCVYGNTKLSLQLAYDDSNFRTIQKSGFRLRKKKVRFTCNEVNAFIFQLLYTLIFHIQNVNNMTSIMTTTKSYLNKKQKVLQ